MNDVSVSRHKSLWSQIRLGLCPWGRADDPCLRSATCSGQSADNMRTMISSNLLTEDNLRTTIPSNSLIHNTMASICPMRLLDSSSFPIDLLLYSLRTICGQSADSAFSGYAVQVPALALHLPTTVMGHGLAHHLPELFNDDPRSRPPPPTRRLLRRPGQDYR